MTMLNLDHFPDTVYAIQHLAFEDLGAWEDVFYQLGLRVRYFEAGIDDLRKAYEHPGLTVILGGPIGVYETENFPFLQAEIDLLKVRLDKNLPTLGICLGAQLIAHALGAKVYAGQSKEMGWSKLSLAAIENNPLRKAELLASTELYANQAFRIGSNILALQFHPEVASDSLEKWLIGHSCELSQAKIDIPALRAANLQFAPVLETTSQTVLEQYLAQLNIVS